MACSDSVNGKKLLADCQISLVLSQMCAELDTLINAVDDIPPHKVHAPSKRLLLKEFATARHHTCAASGSDAKAMDSHHNFPAMARGTVL
jgi:hypothetical protein